MTCPVCGRPVSLTDRACARCGAPLQTPPVPAPGAAPTSRVPTAEPLLVQSLSRPARTSRERRTGALPIVVLSLVALVALAVSGWVLLTRDDGPPARRAAAPLPSVTASATPSRTPTPSATTSRNPVDEVATAQAGGLDALVDRSSQSRGAVAPAATALSACTTSPAAALAVFEQAAAGRRALLGELDALPLDALPEGAALRSGFAAVLRTSADADDAFAAWARRQGSTCTPDPGDPDLVRGLQVSATGARPAKDAFVGQWNPVAARYGLPARAATAL